MSIAKEVYEEYEVMMLKGPLAFTLSLSKETDLIKFFLENDVKGYWNEING